jgi:hypothetical protein
VQRDQEAVDADAVDPEAMYSSNDLFMKAPPAKDPEDYVVRDDREKDPSADSPENEEQTDLMMEDQEETPLEAVLEEDSEGRSEEGTRKQHATMDVWTLFHKRSSCRKRN